MTEPELTRGKMRARLQSRRGKLRRWVKNSPARFLRRARQQLFIGPDLTRWLNRLLNATELTPEQRTKLALSGAWITAPLTVTQNLLAGVAPNPDLRHQSRLQIFAETLSEIDPAILHRYWPGQSKDLERIRSLLSRVSGRNIDKVLPMNGE